VKLTYLKPHRSITRDVAQHDLNDFVVLSGPNGSGKSHLLEAIASQAIQVDDVTDPASIRHFSINQLVALAEGPQATNALSATWQNFKVTTEQVAANIRNENAASVADPEAFEADLLQRLANNHHLLTHEGLLALTKRAGKRLSNFSENDFQRFVPLIFGPRDPFQLSITELFLSYRQRYIHNKFQQWLRDNGDPTLVDPIDDTEFKGVFGAPPWELLDSILDLMGMDYTFVPPQGTTDKEQYQVKLAHEVTGVEVTTDHLSSGERTLLALAMTLYTGSQLGEAVRLPRVLLLDEPDASLHPAMVRSLLRVVRETFVATYQVKVFLTTHSATTVALAPEDSLYVMRRAPDPRLRPARSRDDALSNLTVGLATLSVEIRNRRTVFVESVQDQSAFQEMYRLLRPWLDTELSLDFIASGRGGQGNSEAVKYLVRVLREKGNDSIWGIIDQDGREAAPPGVVFNSERYSIENITYDPFVLGAYLLREGIVASEQLNLEAGRRHFDLGPEDCQHVVDAVSMFVADNESDQTPVDVDYVGGFQAQVPKFWLTMKGHDLEDRLRDRFPPLRTHGHNLALTVITKGFGDLPDLFPSSVLAMLEQLVSNE
jgi:predicted ATPase